MKMALEDLKVTRMRDTYALVKPLAEQPDDLQKACRSRLTELPALLLTHGFGQTVAFLVAKAGDRHPDYDHIWRFLCSLVMQPGTEAADLHKEQICEALASGDSRQHRRWLQDALAYSEWLKRWGEALLKEPEASAGEVQAETPPRQQEAAASDGSGDKGVDG